VRAAQRCNSGDARKCSEEQIKQSSFSRRAVLASLVASPFTSTAATLAGMSSFDDAYLLALGRSYGLAATTFDQSIVSGDEPDWRALDEMAKLETEIVVMEASTVEGFCVKAQVACRALLGDLDPASEPTTQRRMALSIVRDLIRLYNPKLEQPGALQKLLDKIESGASNHDMGRVENA
jgi:predicted RNA-binding protein